MVITPFHGNEAIDLIGLSNAQKLPNGSIQIAFGAAPAAGDVYHVPQPILDQLGDGDYQALMVFGGLPADLSVVGTISVREPIPVPEGVFVQTFDGDGNALGGAGERIDTGSAPFLGVEDDASLRVTPLAGGGFAVHWVVDQDGDTDPDMLAVQRFAADGSKAGDAVLLTGFSTDVLDLIDNDGSYDFQALEGGGYALAYTQTLDVMGGGFVVQAANPNLPINGQPVWIYVGNAPAGLTYTLNGVAPNGEGRSLVLTPEDGEIRFDRSILDQFGLDFRSTSRSGALGRGRMRLSS